MEILDSPINTVQTTLVTPSSVRCPIIQFRLLSSQTITSLLDSKSLQRTTKEYSWWNYSVQQTNLIGCSIGGHMEQARLAWVYNLRRYSSAVASARHPPLTHIFPSLWLQALQWVTKRGDRISGIGAQSNTHETIVLTTLVKSQLDLPRTNETHRPNIQWGWDLKCYKFEQEFCCVASMPEFYLPCMLGCFLIRADPCLH